MPINDPFKITRPSSGGIVDPFAAAAAPAPIAKAPSIARPKPSGAMRRIVGDTAVDLGRGVIGVGEAVVGAADIVTGGHAGKALESIGYKPQETKDIIGDYYSPERKEANQAVADAEGFFGTAKAMIQNPSTIAGAAVESAPLMLGGGAVARGLGAAGGLVTRPVVRAAIGEGAVGAGAAAEGIRQQTSDGLLTPEQTGAALGAGAGTAVLGAAGGAAARRLGIGDVDVALAGGATITRPSPNIVKRAAEGMVAEGVLEELPQSMQEQAWQNVALDRPIEEGVAEAGAQGLLAGAAMGGGFAAISRPSVVTEPAGPITQATSSEPLEVSTPAPKYPDAKPGSLSDASNALPDRPQPAAGGEDLFASGTPRQEPGYAIPPRADDTGFRRTLDEQARAAQPQVDPGTGEILVPAGDDGAAPRTSRWLDDAGVPRPPSDDELAAFMHETLDAMGSPTMVKRGDIFEAARAEDGALKGQQLHRVFKQVWADRTAAAQQAEPALQSATSVPATQGGEAATAEEDGPAAEQGQRQISEPVAAAPQPESARGQLTLPSAQDAPAAGATQPVVAEEVSAAELDALATRNRTPPAVDGDTWDTAKVLREAPVGHVATQLVTPSPKNPDGGLRWTKRADGNWTDGETTLDTNALQRRLDGVDDDVLEGTATRVKTPAALPAPAGEALKTAAHQAATSPQNDLPQPTDAQKEAGNYQKGHHRIAGLDISIENPAGSKRRPEWPALAHHYGYIRGTVGKDKDHVDVFMTEQAEDTSRPVFVVDQYDPKSGKFDEHKVVMGAVDEAEARKVYQSNYSKDWQGLGAIRQFSHDEFKAWVRDPKATKQPAVKPVKAAPTTPVASTAPSVNTLVGRIADGEHVERALEGLDDATARAVAVAIGHRFAKTATTVGIAGNLGSKSQPDLRKAAERAFEVMASPEEKAARDEARPGRQQVYNAKVRSEEQRIAIRQRVRPDGSIGRENREPFKNKPAAEKARRELPTEGEFAAGNFGIYKVDGGFVLKPWPSSGFGAVDPNYDDKTTAASKQTSARNAAAAERGLVVDKFGNMVTAEEAARIDEAFDDDGEPRPGFDENGNRIAKEKTEPKAHANATAPEHVTAGEPGISVAELKEMAAGWRGEIESGKDEGVTKVFNSPTKDEIVRLADKVKVYNKDHGWMTVEQAKKVIDSWEDNVLKQGRDPKMASANRQKIVLSLFDLTGKWSQPWEQAGYEVWRFDIQDEATYEDSEGNERKIGDVNNMSVEFFNDLFGDFEGRDIHAVLAACPCTDFAVSGARHFAAKDADGRTVASVELVKQTLALVEYYKPAVWAVENPVGRIESLTGLPPWRLSFDPNHLGDPYTKKTLLWGRFNADLPIAPVEPTEGSKMHRLYGGKSMATKNARSETPEGFSYGFFQANNAIDHPAQTMGWIYDRLPRALFDEAVAAGMTREDVANAIDDAYYIELDDEAAEAALREAIAEKSSDADDNGARWDAMTPAQREAVLKQDGGWGTKPGAKMALNPTGRTIAARNWADQPEGTRSTIGRLLESQQVAAAAPAPKDSKSTAGDKAARTDQPTKERAAPAKKTASSDPLASHTDLFKRLANGEASLDEYKSGWQALQDNRAAVIAHLESMTKDKLVEIAGYRYRNENKAVAVRGAMSGLESDFGLSRGLSFGMSSGDSERQARAKQVEGTTDADLKAYADKVAEHRKAREERIAGAKDPKTISEFEDAARLAGGEAKLSREHREAFDALRVKARQQDREATAKRNAEIRQVDTGSTGMTLVETKHTQKGHDLFVVRMDDRVERDVYERLNVAAKRLGGHYSSYRGNGAIPGFTFTTRPAAEQFMAVRGGNVDASGQQQARAEAKAESRAESLAEKAANLKAKAEESLGRDRKANTNRRAAQAASAEADARQQLALASTMTNLAQAIESGDAGMLAFVRHKSQVEMFDSAVKSAHWEHLREQGVDWEKAKETPLSAEALVNTKLPQFHLSRGDAAVLARRLIRTRGGKATGEALAKMVDYGDEYREAVGKHPHKFALVKRAPDGSNPSLSFFGKKREAEAAVARSPDRANLTVVKMPGAGKTSRASEDWLVTVSPEVAIERKLWAPDYDQKVALNAQAARKIVDLLGVTERSGDQQVPYWWVSNLAKRDVLAKLGIETNYEYREALRQYLAMRETPAGEDKVRKLERALVGNKAVGVDFFPTPPAVVQRLIEQADIQPGMRVLEPSAGKGDVAEAARDAADDVTVDTAEMSSTLREILDAKGFETIAHDFLEHTSEPVYDRIVMNPPFNNDNGASHVRHAFDMLKPGGRLVAVMGNGARGAEAFNTWLEEVGGLSEPLPEGSFKSSFRPTGVATKVVVIDKSEAAKAPLFSKSAETRSAFTDAANFAQAVAQFERNELPKDRPITVTTGTPDVLRKLGAKDLPIEINPRELVKVMRGEEFKGKHDIGKLVLQQLVRQLHEPVAVFDAYDQEGALLPDSRVILTELREPATDEPIMVAIRLSVTAGTNVARINSIRSAYGRPEQTYRNWLADRRLIYLDQSKTPAWLTSGELSSLKAVKTNSRGSDRKVLTEADVVKPFSSGVGQYSRGRSNGAGLSMDEGLRLKRQLTAKWGEDAPRVVLVEGAEELAAAARSAGIRLNSADLDRVEGMHLGEPTVWLNLAEIRTPERFQQVLTHEALGHFGVEEIVGKDWQPIVDAVDRHLQNGTGAKDVRDAIAQLRRTQPDIFGITDAAVRKEIIAKEVLAVMAENGSRNGLLQRVIAAVRRFLRKLMPEQKWTDTEIRDLINQADRFLHRGRTNEQAQATARAFAFSQKAGPFYSALAESVAAGKGAPKKGSAEQWKGWLDGAQRRGEFRQAERDWLGLDAWLNKQGAVTRDQIADFIRANQVEVQDVVLGDIRNIESFAPLPDGWTVDFDRDEDGAPTDGRTMAVLDENGEVRGLGENRAEAIRDSMDDDVLADTPESAGGTKFASYQLPGGENYRELLLTLPDKQAPLNEHEQARYGELWNMRARSDKLTDSELVELHGFEERLGSRGDGPQRFESSHFDQPNILAHVRFNERTDADGKRVLFIEEIQSDWHQQGRKLGYGESWDLQTPGGELISKHPTETAANAAGERWLAGAFSRTFFRIKRRDEIPDAPFKSTDEWAMLAFKRMVRVAAEGGFDRIAWTTGEQQAARYDLSKQVQSIGYRKTETGYTLYTWPLNSTARTGWTTIKSGVKENEISEYVGKDVADKIVAGEGTSEGARTVLTGKDLRVGGAGMRGFYDKILPSAVNKWAKKFGGKVGHAMLPGLGAGQKTDGGLSRLDEQGDPIRDPATVHAIDLTPAMREAALAGQPLFSRGSEAQELDADAAFVAGLSDKERASPAMQSFAQAMYADLGTDSPFFRDWFGDSKVVDKDGNPLKVYHGTNAEFEAFDPKRLGKSTNHMTASLGTFFDARKHKAEHYARVASNDVPAEMQVYETYLSIQKPYKMDKDAFMAIDSVEKSREIRARLEREGHDGIELYDIGQWIAFEPEQIKRTDNRGAFNRSDARMLFSRAPADVIDEIQTDIRAINGEVEGGDTRVERVKQWLKDATPKQLKDRLRGTWLGALTTRHLTQLGADYFPTMGIYSDYLAEMGADRNALQQEGENTAEGVRKWAGKNRVEAAQLFDLMHDATIMGVDPAEDYQPLQFTMSGRKHEVTSKNVREALKVLREVMRGRAGDDKRAIIDEGKSLRAMLKAEPKRKARYPELVARWNQFSPDAQANYREMRDLYAKRHDQTEAALIQRINDLKMEGGEKRKQVVVNMIRKQFEEQRLQGVYFPLQRFGKFFVAAEKGDASTFLMFESQPDLHRAVKGLRERGYKITAQGLKTDGKAKDAPSGTFVAEVLEHLAKSGVADSTRDEIYQMYLHALPEMSMRKHKIHRKSVPGWDPDALRAFAYAMHHGAHQLARLRYAHKLSDTIEVLQGQQDARRKEEGGDTARIVAGDGILDELRKRHQWISNPQDSKVSNLISSFGFTYYLGLTPAAALVNLTQVPMLAYPYLASRFGGIKAMNALLTGMRGSVATFGHVQRRLTDPEEIRAHKALQEAGALDKTQVHNLAGIAEGGLTGYNPKYAKAMELVGKPFHVAEVINREATGMAAFRLARAAGMEFDAAVKVASEAIQETMFDYSNANRARFMQSGTAKVLLMFRQYSLNMTWHMSRMLWQATKAEDPEVKRIARRNLAGVLGMSALFSGAMGLPLMSVTMGILNAVAASGGDDDEPWDAETEFRAFLVDMLGADAARVLLGGVANEVTGADVASRVSLSQLWFRDADRELDGRGAYYNLLEQAAGPMGGVLKNALVGKQMIDEGHLQRGVETMLPKALKDTVKAARYASEGANNLRGDPLVADLNLGQALLQAAGFTPAKVADQYDRNRALKNYEQHVLDRRQRLTDAFAMAVRLEDSAARVEALEKIRAFNEKWPEIAITRKGLRQSLASRARYSEKAENGIMLNPKIAARVKARIGGADE